MSGKTGSGIGDFKGFYATTRGQRRINSQYYKRHDVIYINVPLGTRKRIQDTGFSQQSIFNEVIQNWLEKKRKELNDGLNNK